MALATFTCCPWLSLYAAGGAGDVLPVTMLFNSKLSDDPIYRKRLEEGLIELRGEKQIEIKPMAKIPSGCSCWALFAWLFMRLSTVRASARLRNR